LSKILIVQFNHPLFAFQPFQNLQIIHSILTPKKENKEWDEKTL